MGGLHEQATNVSCTVLKCSRKVETIRISTTTRRQRRMRRKARPIHSRRRKLPKSRKKLPHLPTPDSVTLRRNAYKIVGGTGLCVRKCKEYSKNPSTPHAMAPCYAKGKRKCSAKTRTQNLGDRGCSPSIQTRGRHPLRKRRGGGVGKLPTLFRRGTKSSSTSPGSSGGPFQVVQAVYRCGPSGRTPADPRENVN